MDDLGILGDGTIEGTLEFRRMSNGPPRGEFRSRWTDIELSAGSVLMDDGNIVTDGAVTIVADEDVRVGEIFSGVYFRDQFPGRHACLQQDP